MASMLFNAHAGFAWSPQSLPAFLKIHQRGVQWKQGVVIHMMLYTSLLYDATQIHYIPLPLHPSVMNTHSFIYIYPLIYIYIYIYI